jgi:hypothetical protein
MYTYRGSVAQLSLFVVLSTTVKLAEKCAGA